MNNQELKNKAEEWVNSGKPCVYRYGWGWKGASARPISPNEAKKMLPNYSFGMGFHELSFISLNGEDVLQFNELSANDMM